ncbi:MAG: hypothetical protein N4A74_24940, partial [Carboxylicivirga sp.]|nr:hypothetical protein [Carboxylicivirga sp.]
MKILIVTILFHVLIFSVSAQSKYIVYIDIGFEDIHRNNIGTMTSKRNKKPHVSPINYTNTIISALEKSYFNKSNFETTELTEEESVKLKDLPTKKWAEYLQFDAENYTHSLVITKSYYQLDMSKASYLYGSGFFAGADQSCTVYAAMNFTFFNLRNRKHT